MKRIFLLGFLYLSCFIVLLNGQTLEIVTSDYPPYNFQEDSSIKGLGTEIVQATLKEAGLSGEISLMPWSRAYAIAQDKPNVIIYSMIRTTEREHKFKWIGEIAPNKVFFYTSCIKEVKVNSINDARKYRIGVIQDDFRETFFLKNNFILDKQLIRSYSNEINVIHLINGKLDLVPENEYIMNYYLKKNNISNKKIKKISQIEELSQKGFYFALSNSTSDEVHKKLVTAYNSIKKKGIYKSIYKKYFG